MKKEKLRKLLGFKCLTCGSSRLDLVYDCLTAFQEVTEVYDDASVYVTGPLQIIEDHGHWYRCHDCETSLVDWDKANAIWTDDSRLVDWLLGHCSQNGIGKAISFKDGTTLIGEAAMVEALRVAVQSMKDTKERYGERSIPTANSHLVISFLCRINEAYGPAKSWSQRYVDIVSKERGPESHEVLEGLIQKMKACNGWDDYTELLLIHKKVSHLKKILKEAGGLDRDTDPLVETLRDLAMSCKDEGDEIGLRRGFVFAVMALNQCVTSHKASDPVRIKMIRPLRELVMSFGIDKHAYEWLVRDADQAEQEFVGFLSVIDEEGLFSLKGFELEPFPRLNLD